MKKLLLLSSVLSIGAALSTSVNADSSGFAARVQSTKLQGQAYAGSAVYKDVIAQFVNPATLSQINRFEATFSSTGILPSVKYKDERIGSATKGIQTSNAAKNVFTGAAAIAVKLHNFVTAGLAVTTPYGLKFDYGRNPAVTDLKNYVTKAEMKTVAITPSIAFKVNPMITLGLGMDVQWTDIRFSKFAASGLPTTFVVAKGDDWSYRLNTGILIEATEDLTLGFAVKTQTKAKIRGTLTVENPISLANIVNGNAAADIVFPTSYTFSAKYDASKQWSLFADIVRTNWSSINNVALRTPAGNDTIIGGWKDVYAFSLGTSYDWRQWTFRGGLGFSNTPTNTVNSENIPGRVPGVPDSNKKWLAIGVTYAFTNGFEVSGSYGHEFFRKAKIEHSVTPTKNALNGHIKEHVNLISLQATFKI